MPSRRIFGETRVLLVAGDPLLSVDRDPDVGAGIVKADVGRDRLKRVANSFGIERDQCDRA